MVEAVFERIDVVGVQKVHIRPTWSAARYGWANTWDGAKLLVMVGARGLEPAGPTPRIVLPEWIADALRAQA